MPVVAQDLRQPLDAIDNPVPALGSYAPNADAAANVAGESRIVLLTGVTINLVTVLTGGNFLLKTGHVYEIRGLGFQLGFDIAFFQIGFGMNTDPVAGTFSALPGAAGGANGIDGLAWCPFMDPPFVFVALPGQNRIALKNMTAFPAGTRFICIRRMC